MSDNQKHRRSSDLPGTVGKFTKDPITRITEMDIEDYRKQTVMTMGQ